MKVSNINQRQQIQEIKQRNQKSYFSMITDTSQIIWNTDAEGEFVTEQPSWSAFTGQTYDQLKGWGWLNAVHPQDQLHTAKVWSAAVVNRTLYQVEHRLQRYDGEYRYMIVRAMPVLEADGSIREWVGAHTDVTERKQVEDSQRLLAEASAVLAASLDYKTTLVNIAKLAVPTLADYCFFDLVTADGKIQRVAWEYAEFGFQEWSEQMQCYLPPVHFKDHFVANVLLTGKVDFVPKVSDVWMQATATSAEQLQFMRNIKLYSLMTVPLIAGDRKLGVLTFCLSAESGRHYTSNDLTLAENLAQRAALALENARLYQEAQLANRQKDQYLSNLKQLHRINTTNYHNLEDLFIDYLQTGCEILNLSTGIISQINHQSYVVRAIKSEIECLKPEKEFKLNNTYCLAVTKENKTISYRQVGESSEMQGHPVYQNLKLESYIGTPIFVNNQIYGTLNFSSTQVKHGEFQSYEVEIIELMAQSIGRLIAAHQAELERKWAQQEAERLQQLQIQMAELERLNRLKDDFLSTVSHELRTPMTKIKMATKMLEISMTKANGGLPTNNQYIQILKDECHREIELIDNLLDLQCLETEAQPKTEEIINLQIWLPQIVKPFEERAKNRQQILQVDLPADLPSLVSNSAILERGLTELLSNACKYTPPGERIIVTACIKQEKVQLQVSNSGVEIPERELPHIFNKFYRVPNADPWKQGGTGLGLALVQKLIEHLEGTIWVESTSDETCFTVSLPIQGSAA